jgi:thioredoxin reductase (NADPH)
MKHCNVAIIGAGCGGLTAAIYCARAELAPVVFTDQFDKKGGMLSKTSIVENYPGYPDGIDGGELIANMEAQAVKYGAEIIGQSIVSVDKEPGDEIRFRLMDDAGTVYIAKAIIIATGSTPNKLGLPDEDRLWGFGISSCAVCDGALYKKKKIIVVGGGDSAIEESLFLTKFSDVILIHRRDTFRASTIMQKRLFSNPKINIMYNTQVTKLIGSKYLEAVELTNNDGTKTVMEVDGLFYGLGLTPNVGLFKHLVEIDRIIKKVNRNMTSCEGIFVCGDVADEMYRQAVVAAGDGCIAALNVIEYLDHP